MKYFTKEWYEMCQNAGWHLNLSVSKNAEEFSDDYYKDLYTRRRRAFVKEQKELAEAKGKAFDKAAAEVAFLQQHEATVKRMEAFIPQTILAEVADTRVLALDIATKEVKQKLKAFCEQNLKAAEEMGITDKLKLKVGIFGAEPWTEEMRHAIEEKLGLKAYDIYGLSEIMGPGVACECEYQCGMYVWEDMFIPEIIDPDTGEVLPYGEEGELVFTTLTKEGFPVIRYRTRDICSLIYEPCKCGRTFIRMNKPSGRSDDMMIIRGVNVFPSQIEEVLLRVGDGVTPNYQIVVDRVNNTDTLEVRVEMSEKLFADDVKSIEKLEKTIRGQLQSVLGLSALVRIVGPKSIERSEGKAKRVIDKRKLV